MSSRQAAHLKACEGRSASSVRHLLGLVWGKTCRDEPGVARGLGGMTDSFYFAVLAALAASLALPPAARAEEPGHPSDDDLAAAATAGEAIVITHALTAKPIVGVMKNADGAAIKLQIHEYYDTAGTAGWFTLHWAAL
jgi:hypothetical protein